MQPVRGKLFRHIALSLLCGVALTLVLSWVVPVSLLRSGWSKHSMSLSRPWTAPDGLVCGVLYSHLWHSDAVSIRTVNEWDSFIPMGEPAPVPTWAALPRAGDHAARIDTGATGWPFRAFASESHQHLATGGWTEELRYNLVLYTTPRGRVMLPLRPLWWGLIGNILVFAATCQCVFMLVGWARRRLRENKGRCPACGYDLSGVSGPCPECGKTRKT